MAYFCALGYERISPTQDFPIEVLSFEKFKISTSHSLKHLCNVKLALTIVLTRAWQDGTETMEWCSNMKKQCRFGLSTEAPISWKGNNVESMQHHFAEMFWGGGVTSPFLLGSYNGTISSIKKSFPSSCHCPHPWQDMNHWVIKRQHGWRAVRRDAGRLCHSKNCVHLSR